MPSSMSSNEKSSPFDMGQLFEASKNEPSPPEPVFIAASDGVKLALRCYKPPASKPAPQAVLVFYHGGGAYSAGGYPLLARGLADKYNIQVYTPDLRGHGMSEGDRGDSPTAHQVSCLDVNTVLNHVIAETADLEVPIYLGGHSSGAGLALNYATTATDPKFKDQLSGYLLVSPQLGPMAKVAHDDSADREEFAKVQVCPFILNAITGAMGHYPAVQFQYPKDVLEEDKQLVAFNTVNMANAISPTQPKEQLEKLVSDANGVVAMWMGGEDELFDVTKVVASYFPGCITLPKVTHLGILVGADNFMGPWILEQAAK